MNTEFEKDYAIARRLLAEVYKLRKMPRSEDPLFDVAKDVCHRAGLSWRDPRTGKVHPPPRKPKPRHQ